MKKLLKYALYSIFVIILASFALAATPVLDPISDRSVDEEQTLTFNVTGSDADNDTLTYDSNITSMVFTKINDSVATVSWTPDDGFVGANLVNFSLSDGSETVYQTATITVNPINDAPVITSTPNTQLFQGETFNYQVVATDAENDVLSYSLTQNPAGMTIDGSGLVQWSTASDQSIGAYPVTIVVSDGPANDTQTFNVNVVEELKLVIKDLDVKVDGKSDKGVEDGETISKEAEPQSFVEFKIEVENMFTDEEDLEIDDIKVEIIIRDIDDGDDIDDESDEFSLDPGDDKKVTLDFNIPLIVDEETFDVEIHVEGEDDNGTLHEVDWVVFLEVEKERHNIKIVDTDLFPSFVDCEDTANFNVEIINLGRDDEDEVTLEVKSFDLGLELVVEDIELEEGDEDDSKYERSIDISIPSDLANGVYPIDIKTYYDGRLSDEMVVELQKGNCLPYEPPVEDEEDEEDVVVNVIDSETPTETPVQEEPGFTSSPLYMGLLASGFVILLIIVILVIVWAVVAKK